MTNDGRDLRRDSHFGLAPGDGGRRQRGHVAAGTVSSSEDEPIQIARSGFSIRRHELRGLEQNPETGSRWAHLARQGKKVMQFLKQRRYVAVVVDGKVQFYGHAMLDELGHDD